jgi:phosphatidylserine/phosphatidylglycerophosphate/cardiolipin synthase-like enzyme
MSPSPYCRRHAKCVVVDGKRSFVSSANFTDRGQERNIEVGALIDDSRFATQLAQQWDGLVKDGIVGEYRI